MRLIVNAISAVVVCALPTLGMAAEASRPPPGTAKLKRASVAPADGTAQTSGAAKIAPMHWDALNPAALERMAAQRRSSLDIPPSLPELQRN